MGAKFQEEVDMTVVDGKKKKKKSKVAAVEELEGAVAEVPEVNEEKKKKKKKRAEAEAEAPVEAAEEVAEEQPKKKKKKSKAPVEEEEAAPAEAEEPVVEEGEKKKKKKKKAAEAEEEEKAEEAEAEEEEPAAKKAKVEEAVEEEEKAEEEEATESRTVFIGGIPYTAEEETVKKDFEECGEIVSFRFPKDYEGNPKGIAFAQYATKEGLDKALAFNETDYGGKTLRVRIAEDSPPGKGGKKGDGKKGGKKGKGKARELSEKPENCTSLCVKNMSYETTEESLWKFFEGVEGIARVKLLTDRDTGASKGIAFVDFETSDALDKVVTDKQNKDLDGRAIFLDYSGGKGEGKGKDGKKGKGKDGKKGKGKGKKGKGKPSDPSFAARNGSIQEFAGASKSFDSDSD